MASLSRSFVVVGTAIGVVVLLGLSPMSATAAVGCTASVAGSDATVGGSARTVVHHAAALAAAPHVAVPPAVASDPLLARSGTAITWTVVGVALLALPLGAILIVLGIKRRHRH
jgi:hypothetical protein